MNVEQLETLSKKIEIIEWRPQPGDRSQIMQVQNLGQLSGWYQAFQKAYGHKPLYLKAVGTDGEQAWLPAFVVKRPFAGSIVSSMPFLDTGGPSGASHELKSVLVRELVSRARMIGAQYVEVRSTVPLDVPVEPALEKMTLILDLPEDSEVLWKQLNAKVRNQVRKAIRAELEVTIGGYEHLADFYKIYAENMRDLGSPPHSFQFFSEVFYAFKHSVQVNLIKKGSKTIGGLFAISFGDNVIVPWASSLRAYFAMCPNMLLYWETIKHACDNGILHFNFGRSTRNAGTYRFKRQWGAVEQQLYWYTIPLANTTVEKLSGSNSTGKGIIAVWQWLPIGVSTWLGSKVRRYLTQ